MQAAKKSRDPRLQAKLCANLAARRVHDLNGERDRAKASDPNRMHACEVLTWGAQASAKVKEPEHAVSLLQEAIPVVSRSKSVRRAQEIQAARWALAPWESEPFVRAVDEQLAGAGLA